MEYRLKARGKKSKKRAEYLVKMRKIRWPRRRLLHPLGILFKIIGVSPGQNGEDSSINKIDSMID